MRCPQCSHDATHVLDSREVEDERVVRRRRECESCKSRFTTYERVEVVNVMVKKRDGTFEPYNRMKLEQGIWIAFGKRARNRDVVVKILDRLEERWGASPQKEITTEQIGDDVLNRLRDIDEVAFIRFASVCKKFKDIRQFSDELDKML